MFPGNDLDAYKYSLFTAWLKNSRIILPTLHKAPELKCKKKKLLTARSINQGGQVHIFNVMLTYHLAQVS